MKRIGVRVGAAGAVVKAESCACGSLSIA